MECNQAQVGRSGLRAGLFRPVTPDTGVSRIWRERARPFFTIRSFHTLLVSNPEDKLAHHQLDYIELPATQIEATKSFYKDIFGWRFEDYGTDYTSFHDGRISGGFTTASAVSSPGVLLVIYSSDLAGTELAIRHTGGIISKPVFEFPGGRRFHFLDPNGNELAVWSE